jgi:hypothetical protein
MTNEELQFALSKALEVAKGKEEQIKYLVNRIELLKEVHANEINELIGFTPMDQLKDDHTSARITISAIIGIAAGFILALILL